MATLIGSDRATIAWETSALADSRVLYGTTATYSDGVFVLTQVTEHAVQLYGLSSATPYHYRVISRDWYGDTARSEDGTFQTLP